MGAYLILYPRALILTLVPFPPYFFRIPAFIYLIIWVLLQLVSGVLAGGASDIAWWAHIAGFIGGLLLTARGRKRAQARSGP